MSIVQIWKILLLVLVMFVLAIGIKTLINSLSFQLFGKIYPRINTNEKVIALTFDDGPSEMADTILSILDQQNIKATFFLIGDSIQQNFSKTVRIVTAGHEIGNHSYTHDRLIFKSYKTIQEEIQQTDALIRKAGYDKDIHFRPPYGKKFLVLPYYLKSNNRKTIMWDIGPDILPEVASDSKKITEHIVNNANNGSIVILHAMNKANRQTIRALEETITQLKSNGFEFKTVSELLQYE